MRKLFAAVVLAFFASTVVYSATPNTSILSAGVWLVKDQKRVYQIDVEASGPTFEAARMEGFRIAVDQAVGSLLLSEQEISNGSLKRRDIVVYASGFVENFKILDQGNSKNNVKLDLRVWVSHSQIADRLLAKSETKGDINGNKAVAQLGTINDERNTGDRAVALVLRDFPARAFNVKIGQTNFLYNASRSAVLEIPFTIQWNYEYITSLHEVLQRTSQNPEARNCWGYSRDCGNATYIRVIAPSDGPRWNNTLGFNDYGKYSIANAELIESRPKLMLILRDSNGTTVVQQCYNMPELDHVIEHAYPNFYMVDVTHNQLSINGNKVIQTKLAVNLGQRFQAIEALTQAELSVVRESKCLKPS